MLKQRIEAILAKLFLCLVATMLAFTTAELVARRFIDTGSPIERRFPAQFYRHPRPYVMFSGKPSAGELNELGYPGKAPSPDKKAGEFRIFFLGGSTVVRGTPPISDLVEQMFAERHMPQVRVYNFGVVSSVSSMELVKIVMEVADLRPDMIVMYNGGNDSLEPYNWDPRPGYPFNFVLYEHNVLALRPSEYPGVSLFAFNSAILRTVCRNYFLNKFVGLEAIRKETGYLSPDWKAALADSYVRNLEKAHRISKAFGAEFVAFYQPLLFFKEPLSAGERLLAGDTNRSEFCKEQRTRVLKSLPLLNSKNIHVVDLSTIYNGETNQVFIDYIHTLQEANPKVATVIFETIAPYVAVQKKIEAPLQRADD
jgi:hypothetical protein